MRLTRTDDSVTFECEHATTSSAFPSTNADQTKAGVRAVLAEHGQTCSCSPAVLVHHWPSLREALEIMREDSEGPPPEMDPGLADMVAATRQATIDTLVRRD
jgi:hypothetical protein